MLGVTRVVEGRLRSNTLASCAQRPQMLKDKSQNLPARTHVRVSHMEVDPCIVSLLTLQLSRRTAIPGDLRVITT